MGLKLDYVIRSCWVSVCTREGVLRLDSGLSFDMGFGNNVVRPNRKEPGMENPRWRPLNFNPHMLKAEGG